MKALVLAEKPSVGKDIARVLNCRKGNGYLENDKYIVTWALGHLVTLADPEKYDSRYKSWELGHLPIMPEKLELTVIKQTAKQYNIVKEQLNRKDVGEIIIATDAGREGELVARWILDKAHCRKKIRRLWISSVTDKAIKEGFMKLKDGKEYVNLYQSAGARAEADWLVGINATRGLTTKFNSQLSCGRVQTPTVALIHNRENEIRDFKPQLYYTITGHMQGQNVTFTHENAKLSRDKAAELVNKLRSCQALEITEISKQLKKKYPPALYDLTELQRDASRIYGYSPKETLNIMQKLYEHHKVLTYPRTDSRYISSDIVPTLKDRIKAAAVGQHAKGARSLLNQPIKSSKHFVDDGKVSDHHAIIPTEESVILSELNSNERKIYDLVIARFLSVFYPPYEYEQIKVSAKGAGEVFTAKGIRVVSEGFRRVHEDYGDEEVEENHNLPEFKRGDKTEIASFAMNEHKTKPPSPFTEATLLSAMENPQKYMKLKHAKTLEETGGLGTVATRADIIEKLFDSFLIEKKGKEIFTTAKGRQLLKLAPEDLRSPELTGEWERKLLLIANGRLKREEFLEEIRGYTKKIISEIKNSSEVFVHDNITNTKCEICGKFMLEVNGKKGKMLVCQDRTCGNRKNLSVFLNSRCPKCHKQLEMVGDGEGRRIVCTCGYMEKYQTFEARKKAEKNVPNKREMQKILKDINKQEKNNPLADALKGFKFD